LLLPASILLWNIITNYSITSEILLLIAYVLDLMFIIVLYAKERTVTDVRVYNIALITMITMPFFVLLLFLIFKALYAYFKNVNKKLIYTSTYTVLEIHQNPSFPILINNYVEREIPNFENEELRLEEINLYDLEDFEELPALQPRRLTTTV